MTLPWDTIAPLLADWEAVPEERGHLEALLLAVATAGEVPEVDVVLMDQLNVRRRGPAGSRSVAQPAAPISLAEADDLRIGELFQGRSSQYPGDAAFRSRERITVQVHRVEPSAVGPYGGRPVYALAVFLPHDMGRFIQQH